VARSAGGVEGNGGGSGLQAELAGGDGDGHFPGGDIGGAADGTGAEGVGDIVCKDRGQRAVYDDNDCGDACAWDM
jgi:hypothetical protein